MPGAVRCDCEGGYASEEVGKGVRAVGGRGLRCGCGGCGDGAEGWKEEGRLSMVAIVFGGLLRGAGGLGAAMCNAVQFGAVRRSISHSHYEWVGMTA